MSTDLLERRPWLPYVAPFALFIALAELQRHAPGGAAWLYPARVVLVAALLLLLRRRLVPEGGWSAAAAIGTGLVVLVLWILPEGRYPLIGAHEPFDPLGALPLGQAYVWIAVRLVGAVAVVPIVEEFFWRGFLIRWLVRPDFRAVPLGTFTWYSFLATSVLFAIEHDRWLPGLIAGVAYNLLCYRTRSLRACILSHAATNLGLGVYVLSTGRWGLW